MSSTSNVPPAPTPPAPPAAADLAALADRSALPEIGGPGLARACDRAAQVWLALVMLIGLCTFHRYGITTDEPIRAYTGGNWWRYLGSGDPQYLPADRLRYYGALYDMLGVAASEFHVNVLGGTDPYAPKHLLNFLAMWAGLLGVYKLAGRLGPQPLALFAVVIMTLMPRWYGSFNNPKDIPFATAFVWTAYAMVRWLQTPGLKTTLLFGLTVGLCTAVRPYGILWLPVGLIAGVVAWLRTKPLAYPVGEAAKPLPDAPRTPSETGPAPLLLATLAVSALATTYALWPTLWVSSPTHLIDSIRYLSNFPDGGASLYWGEVFQQQDFINKKVPVDLGVATVDIPAHATFIPAWTLITVPVVTIALAALGLLQRGVNILRRPNARWVWILVIGWLLVPMIAAAIKASGHTRTGRHFYFLLPPLCLLAASGLVWLTAQAGRFRAAWLPAVVAAALYVEVGAAMVRLFPYENLYFSHVIGGLPGAQGKFDVENWNQTFAEAFRWLKANADPPVHVLSTAGTDVARAHADEYGMKHNSPTLQYLVSMHMEAKQPVHRWHERLPGQTLYTIERDGVPLAVVKKIDPLDSPAAVEAKPKNQAAFVRVAGEQGRFDLAGAGLAVPPLKSYTAEDSTGAAAVWRFRLRSDAARKIPLFVGFKGPGKITVNGKAYPVGDRLRFLRYDAYAGMVRVDNVELAAGLNDVVFEADLRHDTNVYIHWSKNDGVRAE